MALACGCQGRDGWRAAAGWEEGDAQDTCNGFESDAQCTVACRYMEDVRVLVSSAGQWLETADLPSGTSSSGRRPPSMREDARVSATRRGPGRIDARRLQLQRRFLFPPSPFFSTRLGVAIPLDDQRAVFALLETDASPRSYLGPPGGPGGFQVLRGALQIYGRALPRL